MAEVAVSYIPRSDLQTQECGETVKYSVRAQNLYYTQETGELRGMTVLEKYRIRKTSPTLPHDLFPRAALSPEEQLWKIKTKGDCLLSGSPQDARYQSELQKVIGDRHLTLQTDTLDKLLTSFDREVMRVYALVKTEHATAAGSE